MGAGEGKKNEFLDGGRFGGRAVRPKASTFPASSGAVRPFVLVSNSQEDRSIVPSMDMAHNSARSPQEVPGDAEDSLSDTATVGECLRLARRCPRSSLSPNPSESP